MKVVVFGATGMVGQGALRESLLAPDVDEVLAVIRTPTGVSHPKLREVKLNDFTDLSPIKDDLRGSDACLYCLGVSSVGMDETAYTRVSYDYPMAAARTFAEINPQTTFVYVSGAGTNLQGRQMWQRVKGRAEQDIIALLPNGYAFRPGMIQPTRGVRSKTGWYNTIYTAVGPIVPLLERIAPKYVTTTDKLAQAMLRAARVGFPNHIVENIDFR
ncbi:epimerase [Actinoplanes sp. TRM 88003]|uniref:Epimerase n=1 Tax=Paractinoplanes aksuensis TaxID=2939490 RepID=A0ABT1DQP5_9ACTN|nr:epimerase [Actinoplanes aksuensis]MCO8273162.1 epimerase [Actinoplanes aksuensis]